MVAPRLDLIFIVDFTLTAIFLVPQLLAWVYAQPEKVKRRAVGMWLVFLPARFSSPDWVQLSARRFPIEWS